MPLEPALSTAHAGDPAIVCQSSIDVIVATCERPQLLKRCIQSIDVAALNTSMQVRLLLVDNGSSESAAQVVRELELQCIDLLLLREPVSGKSRALNRALGETSGDLIGYIDDDEQVHPDWFAVVEREFRDGSTGFIGGPYVPDFEAPPPRWLPMAFPAAIGATDTLEDRVPYRPDTGPVLLGGNAVVRRMLQEQAGLFDEALGPSTSQRQRTGEDHDMFLRYLRAGGEGWFVPELRIDHYVPIQRLTKRHFRTFVHAHASAKALREFRRPQQVASAFGLPRYEMRIALRSVAVMIASAFHRDSPRGFEAELYVRQWCTFAWQLSLLRFRHLKG